jgi:radical SAM protein with 4Fe4S-binding SPASM domain
MKTTTTIEVLRATIGNPVTRTVLKGMSKYCEKDKKNRIEVAIDLFTGTRDTACLSCKAAEKIISKVLLKGGATFGRTENDLKKKFRDPGWARGLSSVIKGIALFGVTKPFTSGAPFQVVWDVTNACNLQCKHCYSNSGKKHTDELTTNQAKKAIDIFDRAGVTVLAFSGGEPLVRPDIFHLTQYAHKKGLHVALATNGTLITPATAQKMKDAGIQFVQISLDGADAETHDAFRGIEGAFDKTIEGIKNSVAKKFFVEISTTVTRHNYTDIPAIIDLGEKLKANWFMAFNFVPTGRAKDVIETDLTPNQREKMLKMLWQELKTREHINVLSTAPQFARVALEKEGKETEKIIPTHFYNPSLTGKLTDLAEFIGGCGAGRFYMAMRSNGDLEPCVFFPFKIGHILKNDFEDLWIHNPVLKELRNKDILTDGCGNCPYRHYCGGCRARAYGYLDNYLSPDPGCIRNKSVYENLI